MIEAIDVSMIDDTKYINKYNNDLFTLNNIKKINIFIGENNSGKSRMLRSLLKNDRIAIYSSELINNEKNSDLKRCFNEIGKNIYNFNEYDYDINKIIIPDDINGMDYINKYINLNDYVRSLNIKEEDLNGNSVQHYKELNANMQNIKNILQRPISNTNQVIRKFNDFNLIYIPILRGIECFNIYYELEKNNDLKTIVMNEQQRNAMNDYKENAKHIYKNKISKAYEIKKTNTIFTAENLYDEVTSKLLGEESGRNFIHDFQKFISKYFYNGEEFTIIPQKNKGYLNVKIGNETDKALHNLGDGIKQLITLFYKIYELRDQEAVFLIEEPEINLHPGYQRKFMEILQLDLFPKHQYFITTHSNHLIDSCFNYDCISIYKFINVEKKNNTFKVINTTNNDIENLQLLGVNNSSVFIANCTIWVEGISDKIIISKYLKTYMQNEQCNIYQEDIHYSFVEYGGNNITHWAFISDDDISTINASGITNRSFIICDNDNDSNNKIKRKEKLKQVFDDNYYELSVREIENTINRNVLEKTLYSGKEVQIKRKYKANAYANKKTHMGTFIDSHYNLTKKYGNNSTGTITNKLDFSKKISMNINNIDDLSEEAKKMCEKILCFIKKSNN